MVACQVRFISQSFVGWVCVDWSSFVNWCPGCRVITVRFSETRLPGLPIAGERKRLNTIVRQLSAFCRRRHDHGRGVRKVAVVVTGHRVEVTAEALERTVLCAPSIQRAVFNTARRAAESRL